MSSGGESAAGGVAAADERHLCLLPSAHQVRGPTPQLLAKEWSTGSRGRVQPSGPNFPHLVKLSGTETQRHAEVRKGVTLISKIQINTYTW